MACLLPLVTRYTRATKLSKTNIRLTHTYAPSPSFPFTIFFANAQLIFLQTNDFAESSTAVIADVDCTKDDSKDLCSKMGVKGYPTIKYFTEATAATGDSYEGGRSYADLKKWADENLGPSCSPANLDLCNDEQKEEIEKYQAMDVSELQEVRFCLVFVVVCTVCCALNRLRSLSKGCAITAP